MALLDDVLAANEAIVDDADVPVPALPDGMQVVIVTCSEIRAPRGRDLAAYFGFTHDEAFVAANAGARVHTADGDVVRSVAEAIAQKQRGEVFVVSHESCSFLEADPEGVAAQLAVPGSTMLQSAEILCGGNFVSARKLAISSAEMLRASHFLAKGTSVHALVLVERDCRLSVEEKGYGVVVSAPMSAPVASGMSASPSPILAAPGTIGGFAPGPVSLFGSGPASSLMGASPSPLMAPPPDLGAGAAAFTAPPPPPPPPGFVMPTFAVPDPVAAPAPRTDAEPPPLEPLSFKDPAPVAPQRVPATKPATPRPPDADDPFRKAAETLERLRRQRRNK